MLGLDLFSLVFVWPSIIQELCQRMCGAVIELQRSIFAPPFLLFFFFFFPPVRTISTFILCLLMMGPDWGKEKDKREEKNRKVRPDERVHKDCTQCTASRPFPVTHLPDQGLRVAVNFWFTAAVILNRQ